MERTFEEILKDKLTTPVAIKGRTETILPMEAMVMAVMNNAMKGDLGAIAFIRGVQEREDVDDHAQIEQFNTEVTEVAEEIANEFKSDGLKVEATMTEIVLLARNLVTINRISKQMCGEKHKDIVVIPQKNGVDKTELSTVNKIYNDLYKQWKTDLNNLRQDLVNRSMQKKMLERSY